MNQHAEGDSAKCIMRWAHNGYKYGRIPAAKDSIASLLLRSSDNKTQLLSYRRMSAPQLDPKQRVAIITGCSEPTSLGAAFARELLQRKWTVFATARSVSTLEYLRDAGCQVSPAAPITFLRPDTRSRLAHIRKTEDRS